LSEQDHVVFTLDSDRDYSTSIELAVAQDGRTYDRCCGRQQFDPKWHVAVKNYQDVWTAELAIDIRYLTTKAKLAGEAWAVSAARKRVNSGPLGLSSAPHLSEADLLLFVPRQD
jgi:hypothetical protein